MYNRQIFLLLLTFLSIGAANGTLQAQHFSYVDEDGIRVFTNIAPVKPVFDLRISGSVPSESAPVPPADNTGSYDAIIEKYANQYNLDPSLIRSIIATESGFNPRAVSPKGARGLMQLMPATAERLGVNNSFDPEENIRGGVKHFRFLMDSFSNDLSLSLAAYNAGENLVQRLGRVPEIRETKKYIESITSRLGKNSLDTSPQDAPEHPKTWRCIDESGVTHLSNIPSRACSETNGFSPF
ncbi:MAG: lytic transglycosylase domain-containing protein [Acidobacteria bacterium]|nr:lytic transglycosylase domain-containing protein [Acidobacteriota bacterium]